MRGHGGEVAHVPDQLDVEPDLAVGVHRDADEVTGMGQRESGPAGEAGLAVLPAAAAGAVELEGGRPVPHGVGHDEPDERVRGEVARPVGGATQAGQPRALVGVEEVDEPGAPSGSTGAAHHTTHATR